MTDRKTDSFEDPSEIVQASLSDSSAASVRPKRPTPVSTPSGHKVYSVPQRFGLTSIFALITLMAGLFGMLRRVDAPPAVYFTLSTTTFAICVVQMLYGNSPRLASAVTGSISLPICFAASILLWNIDSAFFLCDLFGSWLFGWLVGYLCGGCLAGIFLIQDLVEKWHARRLQ